MPRGGQSMCVSSLRLDFSCTFSVFFVWNASSFKTLVKREQSGKKNPGTKTHHGDAEK
jgi:hypothetical protein